MARTLGNRDDAIRAIRAFVDCPDDETAGIAANAIEDAATRDEAHGLDSALLALDEWLESADTIEEREQIAIHALTIAKAALASDTARSARLEANAARENMEEAEAHYQMTALTSCKADDTEATAAFAVAKLVPHPARRHN